jgi:DNA-binding MarR family transcriptional regulator
VSGARGSTLTSRTPLRPHRPLRGSYAICVPKVTTLPLPKVAPAQGTIDQIQAAFQVVAGSITQVRGHERLLAVAGVRLDRAGCALLYKLHLYGDGLRVTDLAELLGVDAPTVTRKIQQLEREKLVARQADPDDGRATRIMLTEAGRRTLQRVLDARREWYDRLVDGWDDAELATFATLLGKFASALERDLEAPSVD